MTELKPDRLRLPNLSSFPSNAEEGMIVMVNGKMYYYNGSDWKELG